MSYCIIVIIYILSKRFFLKRKELSDARVFSINKKEYGYAVDFSERFRNSLKSISDERLNAICLSSRLFEIFITK